MVHARTDTDLGSIGSVAKGSSESLEQRMNAKNIELSAEDLHTSQRLILEEAIAGRLYTGVMYNKYNAVVRDGRMGSNAAHRVVLGAPGINQPPLTSPLLDLL